MTTDLSELKRLEATAPNDDLRRQYREQIDRAEQAHRVTRQFDPSRSADTAEILRALDSLDDTLVQTRDVLVRMEIKANDPRRPSGMSFLFWFTSLMGVVMLAVGVLVDFSKFNGPIPALLMLIWLALSALLFKDYD